MPAPRPTTAPVSAIAPISVATASQTCVRRAPRCARRRASLPMPALEPDRGDERETEQQRADLAADDEHPFGGDVTLARASRRAASGPVSW